MEKRHLSATQISMYLRCPRQYEYRYEQGLKIPPSGALVVGRSWHKAIEHNYKQKIQSETDLPLEELQDCFSDAFDRAFTEEEVRLEDGEDQGRLKDQGVLITSTHHRLVAPRVQPLLVDQEFNLDLGAGFPYTLKGFWDVIEKNGVIADNKSFGKLQAQSDVDKNLQLTLYATAYRVIHQKIEPELRLDCVIKAKTPRAVQIKTSRTNNDCRWFLNLVERVAHAIQTGVFFPNPDNYLCSPKWCGYWSLCRR